LSSEGPESIDEIDKGEIAAKEAVVPVFFRKDLLEILFIILNK
tara:strand:- start:71 stop:199 length:129 start_codon:yes stop_codon:yes gene_type:complete